MTAPHVGWVVRVRVADAPDQQPKPRGRVTPGSRLRSTDQGMKLDAIHEVDVPALRER